MSIQVGQNSSAILSVSTVCKRIIETFWSVEIHGAFENHLFKTGSLDSLSFSCGVLCFSTKGNSLKQQYCT